MYRRYFIYVLRHKWFTFIECFHLGISWLGFIHDWSKFRPSEFFAYAEHFFGDDEHVSYHRHVVGKNGTENGNAFNYAWLLHQKRNKHHWEFWCLIRNDGRLHSLEIPERYRKEMLADWKGAGRAKDRPDTKGWYWKHRDKMLMALETRAWVDRYFHYSYW